MKRTWNKAERRHWFYRQRREDELLRRHQAQYPLRPQPVVTRLLLVTNEFFTAGAVWTKRDNVWSCTEAAPILSWMRTTPITRVSIELLKRGCRWSWNRPAIDRDKSSAGHELADKALGKDSKHTAHEDPTGDGAGSVSLQTGISRQSHSGLVTAAGLTGQAHPPPGQSRS